MRVLNRCAVAALAVAVVIASCTPQGAEGPDRTGGSDATPIGARLSDDPGTVVVGAAEDVPTAQLPPGAEPMWSVELDSSPQVTKDRLVGLVYPDASEPELSIVGLDAEGSPQWRITTNPSCAGFGVTRYDGRDLVVVLDSDADLEAGELATRTTATAFDAADGAVVWGPVDVPGPLRGPGLIFGESPGSIVSDETGPRVMLSAADGSVVADETAGDVVHYEYRGTGLFERGGDVQAWDTATGDLLWTGSEIDRPDGAEPGVQPKPIAETSASAGHTIVLAWADQSSETIYAAHDMRTGVLTHQLPGEPDGAAVFDPVSGTTLITTSSSAGRRLAAVQPDGLLWSNPLPDDASVDVVAGGGVYGRVGTDGLAWNLIDGATRAEGGWAPPATVMPAGPAIIPVFDAAGERYIAVSMPE